MDSKSYNNDDYKQINEYKLQIVASNSSKNDNNTKNCIKKRKVLDEDEFTEKLGSIIERDFFPDLPKLRLELELQEAIKSNDFEKISKLARKKIELNNSEATISNTPANFCTPSALNDDDIRFQKIDPRDQEEENGDDNVKTNLSLNKFLNKFTSEDNNSFEQLQEKAMKKHQEKMDFLNNSNNESKINNEIVEKSLELPSIERQQMIMNDNLTTKESKSNKLVTWKHSNKNTVMFDPEGVVMTKKEIDNQKSKQQLILHENTRFKINPFQSNTTLSSSSNGQAINQLQTGKIGVDGKEMNSKATPTVNGFSFVPSTPCLNPESMANSPLMTWGVIDATPINLKGGDQTPLLHSNGGSHFKIAEISEKEAIGQELANRILMKKRTIENQANRRVNSPMIGSSSNLERLNSMSPAARLLAMKKLGVQQNIDNRLQASYSPLMKSITTPTPRRLLTPSPLISTTTTTTPNTTDNNQISKNKNNKRPKASQFF